MQILHETPVLDRNLISSFVGDSGLSAQLKTLADSGLADQVEMIKITPEILSIEDISKLWAAFATKYRPTAAYIATVVLIESDKPAKTGPPVQTRNVYTIPLNKPVIQQVLSQSGPGQSIIENQKILNAYFVILKGQNFYTETTQVTVDGKTIPATSKLTISDTQISFQLTDDLNLQAGTHTITVVQPISMGKDIIPQHKGTSSEPSTFTIAPEIKNINPGTVTIPANGSVSVTIKVNPKLYPGQKVALLLNALAADVNGNFPAYAFQTSLPSLISNPGAVPTDTVSISINNIVIGQYAIRIQVDGIESPVDYPLGSNATQLIRIQ
jgi:hypothetical protein